MIRRFADTETEKVWNGERPRRLPTDLHARALIKLRILYRARSLDDLRQPPGLRLHALKADRVGRHSISTNMQWRICFVWCDGGAERVEITDYH